MASKRKRSPRAVCLFCREDMGFWNRMLERRFCSATHEQQYSEEMTVIAVERLQKHRVAQTVLTALED